MTTDERRTIKLCDRLEADLPAEGEDASSIDIGFGRDVVAAFDEDAEAIRQSPVGTPDEARDERALFEVGAFDFIMSAADCDQHIGLELVRDQSIFEQGEWVDLRAEGE